jgi:hypothetical protein
VIDSFERPYFILSFVFCLVPSFTEADTVRVFSRNVGLFVLSSKSTHEGTGRYSENVVSWMASRVPPAQRYIRTIRQD